MKRTQPDAPESPQEAGRLTVICRMAFEPPGIVMGSEGARIEVRVYRCPPQAPLLHAPRESYE